MALGGMVFAPADLVLGDADGVLAAPLDAAPAVLAAAEAKRAAEEREMAAILAGTSDRGWVLRAPESRGCGIEHQRGTRPSARHQTAGSPTGRRIRKEKHPCDAATC